MIKIDISNNMHELQAALARLQKAGANMTPVFQDIGEYLVQSTKERFNSKTAPDGTQWLANTALTQKRKGRDDPLRGESKRLGNEIHYQATASSVEVGSNLEYAAVQQFGAKKGQFGKTARNGPIPWGDITARPFLGLSTEDEQHIADIIAEHMQNALK